MYNYTALVVHLGLLVVSLATTFNGATIVVREIGYIWFVLSSLDLFMSKLSFVIIVVLSERKKHHQIEFISKVFRLDQYLEQEFQVRKDYLNSAIGYVVLIVLCYLYATVATIMIWYKLASVVRITEFWVRFVYAAPFFVDKLTSSLITNANVLCTTIIYYRYYELQRILVQGRHKTFESVLTLYAQITELGDHLYQHSAEIMFTRFAHDFMLCTSTTYLLCEMYIGGSPIDIHWVVAVVLLTTNYARVLNVTLTTELTDSVVMFKTN